MAGEKDVNEYLSFDYFDAQLTSLGWKQVSPNLSILLLSRISNTIPTRNVNLQFRIESLHRK